MKRLSFREFLKEHSALRGYARNLRGRKISEGDERHWLGQSFLWEDTPEGHDFWLALHLLWVELVRQYDDESGPITLDVPIGDELGMALLAAEEEEKE